MPSNDSTKLASILTDPKFLRPGDHVHLGLDVTGTLQINSAVDLHELPRTDAVLLSHYRADHLDQEVKENLRRYLPITAMPHTKGFLTETVGVFRLGGRK